MTAAAAVMLVTPAVQKLKKALGRMQKEKQGIQM
jgi:hypothetical protein